MPAHSDCHLTLKNQIHYDFHQVVCASLDSPNPEMVRHNLDERVRRCTQMVSRGVDTRVRLGIAKSDARSTNDAPVPGVIGCVLQLTSV